MHTHTVRTKFTFGDHVRFDSELQRSSGVGRVICITFSANGEVDYIIELDDRKGYDHQPGIIESEMTLLTESENK